MTDNNHCSDEENQKNALVRILESTNNLLYQIEQQVVDTAIDDMLPATQQPIFKKSALGSLFIFGAGTFIGAFAALGTLSLFTPTTQTDTAALIEARVSEQQALTPLANLNLPNVNVDTQNPLVQAENDSFALEEEITAPLTPDVIEKFTIRPRQNLSTVLKKGGLSNREIYILSEALGDVFNLKHLQVGYKVEIGKMLDEEKKASLFSVTIEDKKGVRYTAAKVDTDFFEANITEPYVDIKTEYAESEITGPFISVASEQGIPRNVVHQIIWAFDGPVDFSRDIRKGDTFKAVFEKEYDIDGKPTGNGTLMYADISLRNKKHERYLYKDSKSLTDYYDENGKVARKLFTQHPLKRQRITSKFGKRKHPILGYSTMHWGIDYGAPKGTPIYAPGDGTVVRSGKNGAYGLYVKVKHNSEYSTAYAHMSKIAPRASRNGKKVKAGQIIGYVGTTGRSTGPHLHWELIKNNRKINPKTQRITAQRKLSGDELIRFYAERDRIRDNVSGEIAYAKATPLNEEKKTASIKKKTRYKKTASRQTNKNKS